MPTLILPSRHTDDTQALWRAAIERGWDVDRLQSLDADPSWKDRDPVLYADGLTADAVRDALNLDLIEPPLDFLTRLPGYTARSVLFTTFAKARCIAQPVFIKPAGDKSFQAKVYASGAELPQGYPDDLPVIASAPVEFYVEYRYFILDRVPVTGSPYMFQGELIPPGSPCPFRWGDSDSRAFIERVCNDPRVKLPDACVVDVGLVRYTSWAVVEANPAWASGILACDPQKVLDVLRRCSVPRPAAETLKDEPPETEQEPPVESLNPA